MTTVLIKAEAGVRAPAPNAPGSPALGFDMELLASPLGLQYSALARLGRFWTISNAIAGVSPGGALSTTPPLTLYNPRGSGVLVIPLRATMHYVSGTMPTGLLVLGANYDTAQAIPAGGTTLTPRCGIIGNNSPGAAQGFQGATLAAAPTMVRPLWNMNAYAGAVPPLNWLDTLIDGAAVIKEGASVSLQGASGGAGVSPLVVLSVEYTIAPKSTLDT